MNGKLTADDVRDLIERHSDAAGGNGRDLHNGAYEAIADELNAELGSRRCENVSKYAKECNHFKCSECGCAVEDAEGYYVSVHGKDWEHQLPWSFCPNCGKRVSA